MLIELIFIYYLVFLFNLLTIIFQIRINLIMIHLVQYALLILFINYSLIRKIKIYLIKKKIYKILFIIYKYNYIIQFIFNFLTIILFITIPEISFP